MIVVIRKDTQEPAMRQLAVRLMNQGVRIGRTPGQDADVLTLVGDTWRLDPEQVTRAFITEELGQANQDIQLREHPSATPD